MVGGLVQKWGAKLLRSDEGKIATDEPCCTCTPGDCNLCYLNEAPECIELTLTGVARKSPQAFRACDCVNGIVMELEYQGDATCEWKGSISVPCDCMGHTWMLVLVQESGDYIWRLTGDNATFEVNVGVEDVNCMAVSETLTYQSQTSVANCDYSGASAAIAVKADQGCVSPQPETHEAEYEALIGSKFCDECGSNYPVDGLYVKIENLKCTPPPPYGECCDDCEAINGTYFLERCPEDGWFEYSCNRFIYTFPGEMCGAQYLVCQFSILQTGGTYNVLLGVGIARDFPGYSPYCENGVLQAVGELGSFVLGEAPVVCSNFSQSKTGVVVIGWEGKGCGYYRADRGDFTVWW